VVLETAIRSSIGAATALRLAGGGHRVVLGARRRNRLDSLVSRINDAGGVAQARELEATATPPTASGAGPRWEEHTVAAPDRRQHHQPPRVQALAAELWARCSDRGFRCAGRSRRITRMTRQLLDLTHPLHDGLATHPGLPGPRHSVFRSREQYQQAGGMPFQIDRVDLVGNTGTYLDSPFHRFADGPDLAALPLQAVADLPVVLLDVRSRSDRGVTVDLLEQRTGGLTLTARWRAWPARTPRRGHSPG